MKTKLSVSTILIMFILILTSFLPVMAQKAEIQGWDKAKFGMSPEELKEAYKEEERFIKEFWTERQENPFLGTPYTLSTTKLHILGYDTIGTSEGEYYGLSMVTFSFVNNKLFEIEILISVPASRRIMDMKTAEGEIIEKGPLTALIVEGAKEVSKEFDVKIEKLINFLSDKYGEYEAETGNSLTWTDINGHTLNLDIDWQTFRYNNKDDEVLAGCTITYSDKNLTGLWERKVEKWQEKRKSLEEKGIEVF